jgi:hypothetical protein
MICFVKHEMGAVTRYSKITCEDKVEFTKRLLGHGLVFRGNSDGVLR